jgi:hypothetical protein
MVFVFIHRDDDFSVCTNSPDLISKYTRRLFNQGCAVFATYGSTIVPNGPVLYFPLPYYAKLHVKRIISTLES